MEANAQHHYDKLPAYSTGDAWGMLHALEVLFLRIYMRIFKAVTAILPFKWPCTFQGADSSLALIRHMASEGHRKSATVRTCPARASCSRAAVRQSVSPSGMSAPQPQALGGGVAVKLGGLGEDLALAAVGVLV